MEEHSDNNERLAWINEIYTETAKKVAEYTPQLFLYKDRDKQSIQSHGSSVLIFAGGGYYMITARHCVFQGGNTIPIGVLCNGKGHLKLIKGAITAEKGVHDELDVAVIKLAKETVAFLAKCYKFLPVESVRRNSNITDSTDYLIFGYPISKTSIDNVRERLKLSPFLHISKSATTNEYTRLRFKDLNTREEYYHNYEKTLLLNFNKRKSKFVGEEEMNMSPNPKGISGCGVWYIQSYDIEKPSDADFSLMAIIIEHDPEKRLLIATKTEVIIPVLQNSINTFGR